MTESQAPGAGKPEAASRRAGFVTLYYLSTPLFAGVDVVLGEPIRVAALGAPEWRYGYYAVLFVLGILCHLRPRIEPLVGIGESTVNLVLLFLTVLLPIWELPERLAAGGAGELGFGMARVWNVAIVGAVLILSIKRSERELHALSGFGRRDGTC